MSGNDRLSETWSNKVDWCFKLLHSTASDADRGQFGDTCQFTGARVIPRTMFSGGRLPCHPIGPAGLLSRCRKYALALACAVLVFFIAVHFYRAPLLWQFRPSACLSVHHILVLHLSVNTYSVSSNCSCRSMTLEFFERYRR